jgi:pyruvate/2-oxoglutarate dehydrogenase complex dihydrolipoamide dehydrogenase (E3) component
MKTSEKHAVVLGGSLAGLLAARVLADHFDHVTLIERDVYTDNCETRRGIPQANHEAPWMLATGEDYRYRETEGGAPTAMNRFMHRYMDQVIQLSTHSVSVRRVLMRAFNILAPPTALFHPRVLFRVLLPETT